MTGNASALQLVLTADPTLMGIVRLSLLVSLSAVAERLVRTISDRGGD